MYVYIRVHISLKYLLCTNTVCTADYEEHYNSIQHIALYVTTDLAVEISSSQQIQHYWYTQFPSTHHCVLTV